MRLGQAGLKVSRLCLGTMTYGTPAWRPWVLDEADSRPFIKRALEHGINFFDTADMYSRGMSEEVVGRALKDMARREEFVLATKVFYPVSEHPNGGGLSRKHIFEAIDASLERLGTDYVDLYQIHRLDPYTPIEETLEALHDVVKAGKARYLGASSMFAWQFAKLLYTQRLHGWTRFVSMQNHYNLIYREEEREMLPLCREEGIGVIPWSPLARGFLAGNRKRGQKEATRREAHDQYGHRLYYQDADYDVADRVADVARARGVRPIQVALAWILRQPGVVAPIVGATRLEQLDQLVEGTALTLTDEDTRLVEECYQPHPVLGID
ncbi:MAG TPA: aldo/keto reductase [Vicinamibacterales bacterium]|nr:aldo/keto reductase [Vicinamibacterales bacterium]